MNVYDQVGCSLILVGIQVNTGSVPGRASLHLHLHSCSHVINLTNPPLISDFDPWRKPGIVNPVFVPDVIPIMTYAKAKLWEDSEL